MPRRVLEGDVVSDKMDKTVTVLVERRVMHPVYKKYVKHTDKYAAHDESNTFKIGDRVQIEECRPISKRKSWKVITPVPAGAVAKAAPKKAEAKEEDPDRIEAKKPAAEAREEVKAKKAPAKKDAAAQKATSKKKDEKK